MILVSEARSAELVDLSLAYEAAEAALRQASLQPDVAFPVVIARGQAEGTRFTVKAGTCPTATGVKIGGYWPGAVAYGLPRHVSTILLFNEETGRPRAVIEAARVNAYRTAAADAVAVNLLARPDSRTVAVFGAGNQALHECLAIARIRDVQQIFIVNRDRKKAAALADELGARGLPAEVAEAKPACEAADILVTATGAQAPLFEAGWIRPGTHISCMGADGRGKQELPPPLASRARLFCDLPAQSIEIGEFQHIADAIRRGEVRVTALGDVIRRAAPGRQSPTDITIFDSSGLALQDLFIADALLARHLARAQQVSAP